MQPSFTLLALLSLFLIVVHLGFASATALASAMIPIMISVLQYVQTPGLNIVGMTMILQFAVSIGFILPVNAPQSMVAYGTDTFAAKDFIRTGLALTVVVATSWCCCSGPLTGRGWATPKNPFKMNFATGQSRGA